MRKMIALFPLGFGNYEEESEKGSLHEALAFHPLSKEGQAYRLRQAHLRGTATPGPST